MNTYIVFDLDETLGYFTQFGILWESIEYLFQDKQEQDIFNCVLDLYPKFLRPNMLTIFRYLKLKKQINNNLKILVYTNNQGPKSWCNLIIRYIENKLKYKLFDQIIYAYKINGRHIELNRRTHNKTYTDFKRCSNCHKYDKICFIDDQYHPSMKHKNIYYINIKPYKYDYDMENMIRIFINSECYKSLCDTYQFKINKKAHISKINKFIKNYNFVTNKRSEKDQKLDKILTKNLLFHIQKFLNIHLKKPKNKTRKYQKKKKNKSIKNNE